MSISPMYSESFSPGSFVGTHLYEIDFWHFHNHPEYRDVCNKVKSVVDAHLDPSQIKAQLEVMLVCVEQCKEAFNDVEQKKADTKIIELIQSKLDQIGTSSNDSVKKTYS